MSRKSPYGTRVRSRTRGPVIAVGIIGLAVIGLSLFGMSGLLPSADGSAPDPSGSATPTAGPSGADPLDRSAPRLLSIGAIGVSSPLQKLGMSEQKNRTMELPPNPEQAGWYSLGPAPGQAGATIIVGYIASPKGPGVFAHLDSLKENDEISVTRADGKVVGYRVDKIVSYTSSEFPARDVYAQTPQPTLRIITCGGTLHPDQKPGNVVVYAHQVSVVTPAPLRPARSTTPGT